ncbi:hypothetical protein ABVT39_006164 [Epinephelus coioides]
MLERARKGEPTLQSVRYALLLSQPSIRKSILKTGTEWEILMQMDEHTFRRHLRVTWAQFDFLLLKLNQYIQTLHVGGRPELAMFLWYIGNQNSFRELSDKFNVSQSTAHHAILELLRTLCPLTSSFRPLAGGSVGGECLQNTRLDIVVMIIMSACILHSMCADPTDVCEDHPQGCPRQGDENEQTALQLLDGDGN